MNDDHSYFLEEQKKVKDSVLARIEKVTRILACLQMNREECLNWQSVEKEGLLLQANLYQLKPDQKEISVVDWDDGSTKTISLGGKTKEEALKRLFSKAKRLKRGQDAVQRKIQDCQKRLEALQVSLQALDSVSTLKELKPFIPKTPSKKDALPELKKTPYRIYYSATGYRILVGKSRKDNDALTFLVGKPHDMWLHASDYPGSHVIIKTKGREEPDAETIEEAARLAIDASQAKDKSTADVVVTRQKFLKRIKGKPGQVVVLQKTVRTVKIDQDKLARVKERTNPLL